MTLGDYLVLGQRSAGSGGVAYRAQDRADGRPVEVRVLAAGAAIPPALARRLGAAALIDHPSSVRVLGFAGDHDPPFVVLDGPDAEPLEAAYRGRVPLREAEAVAMARSLAGAVAEAHRLGLSHGAIGVGSVRVTAEGLPRLDFTGLDVGDPVARDADPAADVGGVGAVLHWLVSGRPAPSREETQARASAETGVYDAAAGLEFGPDPAMAIDRLTRDMLAEDPSLRPSARGAADRLSAVLASMRTAELPSSLAPPPGPSPTPPASGHAADPDSGASSGLAGRDRLGRYRLLEKLGQGGMGAVYRGEDLADGAIVALKVLRPEWSARPGAFLRFQKEARLLGEVNNPFVTNLLEVNEDDGVHYLVLEFVSGLSLGQMLQARGRLDEPEALAILADVARALVDAHDRRIVHRDIKPDNILLSERPDGSRSVKLSDFGLARHVVETDSLQLTQAHVVVGTPRYMAPEQGAGGAVDPRTDVYAMGATLYHALAGRPPFSAERVADLIALHAHEPLPPLRGLAPAVGDGTCRIVEKALAKHPDARYADASAFLGDVDRLLRGEPTPEAAHPRMPEADPRDLLTYDFTWDLDASPRQLWPLVTNTERLNRAIGLPAVTFREDLDPASGRLRRFGEARQGGIAAEWEEHPYEWVEPRRMGVLRNYTKGPFRWMVSALELTPRARGGTTLTHKIRIAPRGAFMRAAASLKVGRDSRKALERVYRRIDASLTGKLAGDGAADPFEEPPPLSQGRRKRLERLLDGLVSRGVDAAVVERLGAFLAEAPAQEVTRMRPLALARRLGLDPAQVISACLYGARDGLLVLLWDILCPICRIPSEVQDTLRSLRDHGHCDACRLDYDLDFAASVELIFRVHPEVREADLGVYCIGGPAHSPHVVAQVRVGPGERVELDLGLSEGTYQVRGPQLPYAHEFRVEPSSGPRRLDLDLRGGPGLDVPRVLRAGGQVLGLTNDFDQELVVRIERTASRDDALTAARASSLALFRDLFPGEVLSAGQLISVSTTTLLVTAVEGSDALYAEKGDARAFAILHEHVRLLEGRIRGEGGALIKTVGDGLIATFPDSVSAVRVGLDLASVLSRGNLTAGLRVRAAVHRGAAMAATIDDHLDYFGLTVAQVWALLRLAHPGDLLLSQAVAAEPPVLAALRARKLEAEVVPADLPGASGSLVHRLADFASVARTSPVGRESLPA